MANFPIALLPTQTIVLSLDHDELESLGPDLANRQCLTQKLQETLNHINRGAIPEFDNLLLTDICIRTLIENGLVEAEMAETLIRFIDLEATLEELLELIAQQEPQRRTDWEARVDTILEETPMSILNAVAHELDRYYGLLQGTGYGAPTKVLARVAWLERKVGRETAMARLVAARTLVLEKKQSTPAD